MEPKVYVYEEAPGWTVVEATDETGATVRRVSVRTRLLDHDREVRAAQECLMADRGPGLLRLV